MRKPIQTVTTPLGVLQYPHLIDPDTRFNPEGMYQSNIIIAPGEAADALEATLEAARSSAIDTFIKESGGKKVRPAASVPFERDSENNLVVKSKLVARVVTKTGKEWTQRPALFDSRGQRLDVENLRIGSGTRARLSLEVSPYNVPSTGAGISLRLRGVQVIELVEPRAGRAEDYGFGAQETGFVAESFDNFEDDAKPVAKGNSKKAADF